MRYGPDHKQQTRQKLLSVAARALKRDGLERLAIGGVMTEAGLTHGGFYAHFPSRDALIAEALEANLVEMRGRVRLNIDGKPPAQGLSDYIDFYVSERHRDRPIEGCIFTALGSEAARLTGPARDVFARGHALLAAALAGLIDPAVTDDRDALAQSMVAEMIGAVILARTTFDKTRSDRLLAASRAALKARAGLPSEPLQ
jgi:TetR/AcrR family transcriptional repressor of nem operon